jgi:hypothetical protein
MEKVDRTMVYQIPQEKTLRPAPRRPRFRMGGSAPAGGATGGVVDGTASSVGQLFSKELRHELGSDYGRLETI